MDVFASRLTRARCPSYLVPARAETLHSTEFQRTLSLWLFAALHNPNLRDSVAEVWAKDEPTNKELEKWLLLNTGESRETCQDLMEGKLPVKKLLALLGRIVDNLEGRMMMESSSESMKEAFEMIVDIGTHEQQFFDPICTLFPPSVTLLLSQENPPENSQLEKEIGFLQKRTELLETRMQSLNENSLSIVSDGPQSDEQSSEEKSQHLMNELEAFANVLKAGDDLISEKIACWTHFSRLQDIGMASAASEAHEKLQHMDQIINSLTLFSAFEKEVVHIKQVKTICDQVDERCTLLSSSEHLQQI
uniref:AlNc14C200G8674 protein n=1 Tax=Albugo laibachii Nc14 TaxID=890382 RepID=F0WQK5_9STRA|nr:AlNc14C200G8674 [Albugo laibachii Nc14]CCA24152.1 AlNc14C224G9174 [Albugo laibachii Nc14]|eukprot:CCA24152.1 AlNc14C224G9174 [Albugo laibachii Nc14]